MGYSIDDLISDLRERVEFGDGSEAMVREFVADARRVEREMSAQVAEGFAHPGARTMKCEVARLIASHIRSRP